MKITGKIIFKTFRCPHDTIITSKYNISSTDNKNINVQVQVLSPQRLGEEFYFEYLDTVCARE